ncbi:hypothetical protein SG0102_11700 [Intestinibaculum porci]|uniref:Uncharacterized protein n=1 Tax=Intestinibaculum porci TaxID=2487118 RepID=A0A3G9J5Z5_9FIRM|nr:hypothetical protein [Intestinibaculum porci]BBH26236.1 hypothetical protein SG0102_11700 [Intestinibaculum porci]
MRKIDDVIVRTGSMSGFDRDDLPHYLNLCCFMFNPPHEKLEKIEKLLESDYIKGF